MSKKSIGIIVVFGILCSIYIFIIEAYSKVPVELSWLESRMSRDAMSFDEVGVQIKGQCYGEALSEEALLEKADEMANALSHEDECSRICQLEHIYNASIRVEPNEKGKILYLEGEDYRCHYIFTIKNEQDIHQNSYYELKLIAKEDVKHLDQLRIHATDLLAKWCDHTKEFIYFNGDIDSQMIAQERENLAKQIFMSLDTARTNYYEDEVDRNTCSYYGYCPYIDDYYKEENGYRTNMQIAFSYNEIEDQTDVRVAFPFYNEVF